ncbi:MAG: hypothetical protein ACRDLM_10840 [Gaiellaceae bacterium]
MAHVVNGGLAGGALLEYDAQTGRLLARSTARLLSDSVAATNLTAVPEGVWASFRTGMLGLTLHLRQHDLAMVSPPGTSVALMPANGLFHWPMDASTLYGGGALWLANDAGILACLDPVTANVRASERVPASQTPELLAVDPAGHRLFALKQGKLGLVEITPPRRCWR